MRHLLYPSKTSESTYAIPFEDLYKKGYRGVIFDIDNTLVPHGAPADERAVLFFDMLHRIGYDTMLLSNNKESRVSSFADAVNSKYIYKAGKPLKKGYIRAMERMGTEPSNTLFVGDQIFTDVWGANRAGIYTYLVEQIDPKEEIQIVIKRRLEAVVLLFYKFHLFRHRKKNK
ncbi:MAG: YqeG family HAD IIIA-type phosphatase [Butyrivibrio sp.]|nr:YqeG family HAD IIIA-type phosphatase [Butyrivibrio sp.]